MIRITVTSAGVNISDLLEVWTSPDNSNWTIFSTQPKATLISGYEFTPPMGTQYYQVRDTGSCGSVLELSCTTTTTTTLPPTTTTTTAAPTTTTTTTAYVPPATTTTTTAYVPPATTTTTTAYVPPATTTTTTSGGGTTTTTTTAYVPPVTTTTTTSLVCVEISDTLGYNASEASLACNDSGSVYYGDNSNFISTTKIATNVSCTLAPTGYYSDGFNFRYWDGSTLDSVTTCQDLPSVTTDSPGVISYDSAQLGGNVTWEGLDSVTERGICWSTSNNPLTSDDKQIIGSGLGSFNDTVGTFLSETTYYYRAYAINIHGTGYGAVLSFTTIASPTYNTYNANVYTCGTCVQQNTPGFPDPVKSLSTLVVGYYYNGGDGFIYQILSTSNDPTTTVIGDTMYDTDCAGASDFGCPNDGITTTTTTTQAISATNIYIYDPYSSPDTMCGKLPYQFPTTNFNGITIYTYGAFDPYSTYNISNIYTNATMTALLADHADFVTGFRWGVQYGSDPVSHTVYISSTQVNTWETCPSPTTTTTQAPTTTTTTTVQQVYYTLYKCVPNGINYYSGPYTSGTYSTGLRVEGGTGVFYTISTETTSEPSGTNISITSTGFMGCP